jgi:hypothetical protein
MGYLKRIRESEDYRKIDSAELESMHGLDLTGLSRDEISVLIDQAVADGDYEKSKKLSEYIKESAKPTLRHLIHFSEYSQLNETVQIAKSVLAKFANKDIEKGINAFKSELDPQMSDEEKEAAVSDYKKKVEERWLRHPDYIAIRDMLSSKNPNWVGAFTKFRFIQGADMGTIRSLYSLMADLKDSLKELPQSIDDYSNAEQDESHETPGFEKLGDELNHLLELRKGKWIISALPARAMSQDIHRQAGFKEINLREAFRNAPKSEQLKIVKAASELNSLNKPVLIKAVTQKLNGLPSLAAVLDYINLQIKNGEDTDRLGLIERANAAYPSVVIMYEGPDHLVFSFRNDAQLPFLCKRAKGWCIQPSWYGAGFADRFWTYADGFLQLGIIDFTVDASSPYHTVGVTIRPDKSVYSLCSQSNQCMSGENFETVLKNVTTNGPHSYPQELIDEISLNFEKEVSLKKRSDSTYKKIKTFSEGEKDYATAVLKTITGIVSNLKTAGSTDLTKDDVDVNSEKNVVDQLFAAELKNYKNFPETVDILNSLLTKAMRQGLHTPANVKIFEIMMEGYSKYNAQTLDNIKGINSKMLDVLKKHTHGRTNIAPALRLKMESLQGATDALESLKLKLK